MEVGGRLSTHNKCQAPSFGPEGVSTEEAEEVGKRLGVPLTIGVARYMHFGVPVKFFIFEKIYKKTN